MQIGAASLAAASVASRNFDALGSALGALGADPTPEGVAAESQAAIQSQFAMGILKKSLDIEAGAGAQLNRMLDQGSGVDLYA
jgi:hypothetical protein